MTLRVLVLGGDGVGPEVIEPACRVLRHCASVGALDLELIERPYGLSAWKTQGHILPADTLDLALQSDAVLFGAIGGDYAGVPMEVRREGSVLRLRRELGLYANLRPVRHWPALTASCPLQPRIAEGTDIALVRENTGGLYFGTPRGRERHDDGTGSAFNTLRYDTAEIERVAGLPSGWPVGAVAVCARSINRMCLRRVRSGAKQSPRCMHVNSAMWH